MKKIIKKMAIIAIVAVTMSMTNAQGQDDIAANVQKQGDMAVGVNMIIWYRPSYNYRAIYKPASYPRLHVPSYTRTGISAKFLYNPTYYIRLAGEFDYFWKREKDYMKWWDFSVYSHLLMPVSKKVLVYPSLGLGKLYEKIFYEDNETWMRRFTFIMLGFGTDYELSSNLILNGEVRYKIYGDEEIKNPLNFAIGLAYKF